MFIEKGAFIRPLPLFLYAVSAGLWLWPSAFRWLTTFVSDHVFPSILCIFILASYLYYRHKRHREPFDPITPDDLHIIENGGNFEEPQPPKLNSPLVINPSPPVSPYISASKAQATRFSSPIARRLLKATNIKLLTYNLYLRPPLVHSNEDDYKDERLAEFIKLIPDFDIICLQEVFALGSSR